MDESSKILKRHRFHPNILREYDIRGIVGESLHGEDAYMIGLGFADLLRQSSSKDRKAPEKNVVVGRDGRLSSPELAQALIEGLIEGGVDVLDIGVGPTPKLYFADIMLKADGAIQVTGSHNPPSHNGFKMVLNHKPFFGDDIAQLGASVAKGVSTDSNGQHDRIDVQADYVKAMLEAAGDLSGLKDKTVIWDCGNGAAGGCVLEMTAQLAGQHHVMFAEIDGSFPNHHPDPAHPETLESLRQAVEQNQAIIGIGFDGDGDRIGVIDAKGRHVTGDLITAYLARRWLRQNPPKTEIMPEIIFDVKASLAGLDVVSDMGGIPVLWKTGHSHMKMKLRQGHAPLAGEMSGHIFIAEGYFGFDDALFAGLSILQEMIASGETITDFIDNLPQYYATPELHIACDDEVKFDVVDKVIAGVNASPDEGTIAVNQIDGIRLTNELGWWLIRASNTDAKLVVRAEGRTALGRDELKNQISSRLAQAGVKWTE